MSGWFGGTITLNSVISVPIRVFVADLGGGANATSVITLRPGKGNASDIRFLLVAEIVEYFMHAQNKGWFAPDGTSEQSCGEALSRFLSQQFLVQAGLGVSKPGFEISPQWLNSSLPAANPSSTQLKPLTTLPAPIDNVVTSSSVAAAQTIPFATSYIIQIDGEQLLVTAVNAKANRLAVARGYNGTTAAAHAAQSEVFHNYGSRANYVNLTLEYDHGVSPAPGCGMLSLYYLYVQFGFSINAIIAAAPGVQRFTPATCLRGVYQNLTGDHGDPFPYFKQLLDNAFPPDEVSLIPGPNPDNPFPLTPLRSQDTIANIANAVALAGYYAKDDDTQHVIAGTSTGDLVEVYWKPAQGVHQDVLTQFSASIVGIGAYYAADDNTQHAIVATADGVVTEVYWKPAQGIHADVLTQFSASIVGIGAYYAADDNTQHAIVATADGVVTEVYWKPAQGVHQDVLTQFSASIVGIGAYYAADDNTQHAIVATADGVVTEVYWKPAQGVHQDVVAQLGRDIVGIAGYYAEDDHAQHAIAGTGGGTLIEVFWRPGQGIHRTLPRVSEPTSSV